MILKSAPTGLKGRVEHGSTVIASHRSLTLGWKWGAKVRVFPSITRPVAVNFLRGNQQAPDVTLMLNTSALLRADTEGSDMGELLTFRAPTPLSGFSQASLSEATTRARTKILDLVLGNLRSRRPDASLGSMVVELVLQGRGIADIAATLMLLLECGQQEAQVVAAGTAFLQASAAFSSKPHQEALPDVALCVALAHRHLALAALGGDESVAWAPLAAGNGDFDGAGSVAHDAAGPALAEAYGHVNSALKLVKEWQGKALSAGGDADPLSGYQHLQSQLLAMMRSIAPHYTLHLLEAGPDDKPSRERAMEVLKLCLWHVEGVDGVEHRLELMAEVRSSLSAAEQIALYENAPVPDADLAVEERYDLALAHIWEGYTKRWPHHVYRADSLLSVISDRTDLGLDVRLERSVCALLLGSTHERRAGGTVPELDAEAAGSLDTRDAALGAEAGMQGGAAGLAGATRVEQDEGGADSMDSAVMVVDSDDDEDEQSAMEDWAQHWLELAIMPGFTRAGSGATGPAPAPTAAAAGSAAADTAASPAGEAAAWKGLSVRSYLSSPKVVLFNQVLHYANERNLRSVTDNLQHLSHDALQQLMSLWRSSANTLAQAQKLLPQRQPALDKKLQQEKEQQGMQVGSSAAASADVGGAQATGPVTQGLEGAPRPAALGTPSEIPEPAIAASAVLDSSSQEDSTADASGSGVDLTDRFPSFEWLDGAAGADDLLDKYDVLDGMAVAALHPAQALTDEVSVRQATADRAGSDSLRASDSSSNSGNNGTGVQDDNQQLPDSSSGSLWVQSGAGGHIRPRATARIVNPNRPGQLSARDAMQLLGGEGRQRRGGAVADAVLVGAKVAVVVAFAGAAWLAGRSIARKEEQGVAAAPVSLVVRHLRGLQQGAASLLPWSGAAATTSVSLTLPTTSASIEQGLIKAHRDASSSDLTPRAAAGLLLSWCAATQTPREAKALFPLLLEGGALMQARAEAALRQLSEAGRGRRTAGGASTSACVVVLSLQADSSHLVTVRSRITISREGGVRGTSNNSCRIEEVAIRFRRAVEGGEPLAVGPWRITQVDVLSRS